MSSFELIVLRPWLLLLAIPALAVILVPFFFLPAARKKAASKIASLILHSLTALILVALIAGVSLRTVSDKESVMLLLDLSNSTSEIRDLITDEGETIGKLMKERSSVGAVVFAKGQTTLFEPGKEGKIESVEISSDATDISSALLYAASHLPDDQAKRIVLLTDGKETDNDAAKTARDLSGAGVCIDTVYFDTASLYENEVQVTSIRAEGVAYVNKPYKLTVYIESSRDLRTTLYLSDNGMPVHNAAFDLKKGENKFDFTVTPESKGSHVYTAKIIPAADTVSENNAFSFCCEVTGGPSVLIISHTMSEGTYLKRMLKEAAQVDQKTSYNAPRTVTELCKYDEIVLVNIDADSLPSGYDEMLEEYVSRYGRTLFTVGGSNTYSLGHMKDTLFEELLPVSLEYQREEAERATALLLVLDCSRSMSSNSSNLTIAKQGAIKCLDTLSEDDFVAVVSLAGDAQTEISLLPASKDNKEHVSRAISAIETRKGTSYSPALTLAFEELQKSDAPIKHVIFLSDGQPSDGGYLGIARDMQKAGITISTIGLGFYSYALSDISNVANGRNYSVYSADDLPDIMLSEAEMVTVNPLQRGEFNLKIVKDNAITHDFLYAEIPQIGAYIGTVLKEDASAVMAIGDNDDPLLAEWNYGKGTVVSFMTDIAYDWTGSWYGNALCGDLAEKMIIESVHKITVASSIAMSVEQRGQTALVTVETAPDVTASQLGFTFTVNKNEQTASPVMIGRGLFTVEIPTEPENNYQLTASVTSNGEELDSVTAIYPVPYSAEYNLLSAGGEELLEEISRVSGGVRITYGADEEDLLNEREARTVSFIHSLFIPLGIAAALLYVASVAVRRLRIKDLKAFFASFRRKKA